MKKFVKRNTVVELDINGNLFFVDFGRDEIPLVFQKVAKEEDGINKKEKAKVDTLEYLEAIQRKGKQMFKEAINEILQDNMASERIFQEDDSSIFIGDVYMYLAEVYAYVRNARPEYSSERVNSK